MANKEGEPDLDGLKEAMAENSRAYPKPKFIPKSFKREEVKDVKYSPRDEWEAKYWRESWTFSFGTIMQAYAQLNQGKDVDILAFADKAYLKAEELVKKSINKTL